MSRYAPKQKTTATKKVWINKPKRVYKITTDQGQKTVETDFLNYSKTIQAMRRAGYTNINITFIGYNVTF